MTDKEETSNDNNTAKGIRVFVYGTLKKGHGNHAYYFQNNPEAEYLGRCAVEGPYTMYGGAHFPHVTKAKGADAEATHKIYGEVYRVSESILDVLDILEGHPNWYAREKVSTPWKKAWIYIMQDREFTNPDTRVSSGIWRPTEEEREWVRVNG